MIWFKAIVIFAPIIFNLSNCTRTNAVDITNIIITIVCFNIATRDPSLYSITYFQHRCAVSAYILIISSLDGFKGLSRL